MSSKNFQNEENEIMSIEDEKVRGLLGDLERVDAPSDFDFRLKARIASAKPEDFRPSRLFPVLRYAAPLGLALLILGAFVFSGLLFVDSDSAPPVADQSTENASPPQISQPPANLIVQSTEETPDKKEIPPPGNSLAAANPKKVNSAEKSEGFSRDFGGTNPDPRRPNFPAANRPLEIPKDFRNTPTFPVKDILSDLGIDGSFADSSWKVRSVRQNSLADRSGVRPNDVIEAIDENKLSTETITTRVVSGKKLIVVRGGERIEIDLQNK